MTDSKYFTTTKKGTVCFIVGSCPTLSLLHYSAFSLAGWGLGAGVEAWEQVAGITQSVTLWIQNIEVLLMV